MNLNMFLLFIKARKRIPRNSVWAMDSRRFQELISSLGNGVVASLYLDPKSEMLRGMSGIDILRTDYDELVKVVKPQYLQYILDAFCLHGYHFYYMVVRSPSSQLSKYAVFVKHLGAGG